MKKTALIGLLTLALPVLTALAATEQSAEQRGLEIAQEADLRDTGWGDSESALEMILTNRHGQKSLRENHNKTLEVTGDGDKTMIVFDNPKDVKGTALLSFTHKQGTDDQWLYLPALKRVKRISSANKSGAFMGSEFAYEDIASQEVEKYQYQYLRDELYEGFECFVVARDPVDPKSGYSRQEIWWDKAHYRPIKIDFYDRKGAHMKTLTFLGYQQYEGRWWRADRYLMVNHLTGKRTELIWKDYRFNNGFTDAMFNRNSLKRAR